MVYQRLNDVSHPLPQETIHSFKDGLLALNIILFFASGSIARALKKREGGGVILNRKEEAPPPSFFFFLGGGASDDPSDPHPTVALELLLAM